MFESLVAEFKDINLTFLKSPPDLFKFVETEYSNSKCLGHLQELSDHPFQTSEVKKCKIENSRLLVDGKDVKRVYEMILDISIIGKSYDCGDTIGVLPRNLEDEVEFLIEQLKLGPISDKVFNVESTKGSHMPEFITPRKLLLESLDIRHPPKKSLLKVLSHFTEDQNEKRFLEILSSIEGSKIYENLIEKPEISFIKFIENIRSCSPPILVLANNLSRLHARPYSISNYTKNGKIRIIFALLNEGKRGITTKMLENIINSSENDKFIYCYLRQQKPKFKYLEEDLDKDVIMIGPGTGVAPFLGFLQFRSEKDSSHKLGKSWLYTSCRYKARNYLYEDEIKGHLDDQSLDNLFEAFSRDTNNDCKFVQDQIKNNKEAFVKLLLKEDTKLYLCGEGRTMLPQIQETIVNCWSEVVGISREEASENLKKWKKSGKYLYYSMIRY